jgi:hypothetical protein
MKREGVQEMNVSCDIIYLSKVYVAEGKKNRVYYDFVTGKAGRIWGLDWYQRNVVIRSKNFSNVFKRVTRWI